MKGKAPVIDNIELKHLAQLAQVNIKKRDFDKLLGQFTSTIDLVRHLSSLQTDKVATTSQVTGLQNVFREDVSDTSKCLPPPPQGYYRVKAVFSDEH